MKRSRIKILDGIIIFILSAIALTTFFPFYFMIVSSFKHVAEYYTNFMGIPLQVTFYNYIHLFTEFPVLKMAFNSFLVCSCALVFSTFIVSLAGFVFAKFPYKFSNKIFIGIVACMMVPPIVLLIPVYLLMSTMHLINNYLSLILFYIAIVIPFSLYLITANFKAIPNECLESAMIDGCGLFSLYRRIALPLGMPAIFTLLTLNFLWCWNEFLYSLLFLQTNELRTLTVGVAVIVGHRSSNMPLLFTGLLVNAIPVLLVFSVANKYLVKGLTAGAVKG
jgi:raffinose/stachyose/melibiose transport system permease protein